MKKIVLLFIIPFIWNIAFSQNKEAAEKLVNEGVNYHDKGDYEGAITRYNKALKQDKDNLYALTEKAYSLLALEKFDESIECCKLAIEKHPGESTLKTVYVTYGNALDSQKKTDKSIEIYDEGIEQFPDFYLLHFNKGITLMSVNKLDEAMQSFQSSVKLNPKHAGSHNAIARISQYKNERIPTVLAYSRFLIVEPQTSRSVANLDAMQKIIGSNVEKTGRKSITINVSSEMLADTNEDGTKKENNFSSQEMLLAMSTALDFDKKQKDDSEVQKFNRKFEVLCSSMAETKKDNHGFFWEFYAPYFIEMHAKGYVEIFSYIAFASTKDPEVEKWLKKHETEINEFYEWSNGYKWD